MIPVLWVALVHRLPRNSLADCFPPFAWHTANDMRTALPVIRKLYHIQIQANISHYDPILRSHITCNKRLVHRSSGLGFPVACEGERDVMRGHLGPISGRQMHRLQDQNHRDRKMQHTAPTSAAKLSHSRPDSPLPSSLNLVPHAFLLLHALKYCSAVKAGLAEPQSRPVRWIGVEYFHQLLLRQK